MPEDLIVATSDGLRLAATVFRPQSSACERVILITSGMAMPRRFYGKFAQFFADAGYVVVTFDYRGIGGSASGNLRRSDVTMRDWGESDIAAMIDWVHASLRPEKLFVVAHSAGGQLFGLARNNHQAHALVTVASQSGYWRLWPFPGNFRLAFLWYFHMPFFTWLCGYFPTRLLGFKGENIPAGVASQWARWGRNPHYLSDERGLPLRSRFQAFRGAILAFSFADDSMAPKAAVEELIGFYENAAVERRHAAPDEVRLESIGHFNFFKLESKAAFWEPVKTWLDNHRTPS